MAALSEVNIDVFSAGADLHRSFHCVVEELWISTFYTQTRSVRVSE